MTYYHNNNECRYPPNKDKWPPYSCSHKEHGYPRCICEIEDRLVKAREEAIKSLSKWDIIKFLIRGRL